MAAFAHPTSTVTTESRTISGSDAAAEAAGAATRLVAPDPGNAPAPASGHAFSSPTTATSPPSPGTSARPVGLVHQEVCSPEDGRLQIVDEKQHFTRNLAEHMRKWGMADQGFDYGMVAVFGSQSTGKSTLLNRLFGTSFEEMDPTNRKQTTKGIWMCPSSYGSTLVMDVEGTDGRERGEDQDFERKSALFSLASTQVLLVNIWETQIGLYHGANMGLLRTVFEVNLSLFGAGGKPTEKTLILFVIRDYLGVTPLESLANTLKQDLQKIWDSLSKPPQLANAQLSDYFDLSFAGLPHKLMLPDKFESDVAVLRKRFTDPQNPDYVFQKAYHKHIPADGVPHYMETIWEQVVANKDLDLPTQQEMLAQFRCEEIGNAVTEVFRAAARKVRGTAESGTVIAGLGAMMLDWLGVAMTNFDTAASRYHQGVYQRKRADLAAALHAELQPLYQRQLANARKRATARFLQMLTESVRVPSYNFAAIVKKYTHESRDNFIRVAKEMTIDGSDMSYETELADLDADLRKIADQQRADETKKLVNGAERSIKRALEEPVEVALSKPSDKMWDTVLTQYRNVLERGQEVYLYKAIGYNCTEDENSVALDELRKRSWLALRKSLEQRTADIILLPTLRAAFEDKFRYDENGVPRVWKPSDDLDMLFKKARDETLALILVYEKVAPSDPMLVPILPATVPEDDPDFEALDVPTAFTLISPVRVQSLEAKFKREADAAYVEAKRSMVSSVSQIPAWMYGLLVVLGWNEAMAVLFNPLYFALLVVALATAYLVLQLGLAGPILQVTRTVANEVRRIATDKLREAFAEPPAPQRRLASPVPAAANRNSEEHELRQRTNATADWEK